MKKLKMLVSISLLVASIILFSGCGNQTTENEPSIAAEPAIDPSTFSVGKKLLVVELELILSETDPRVVDLNGQLATISERFGDSEELVGDKALMAADLIRKETGGEELIVDTLDAALVATMGLDDAGELSTVLAIYATSRTTGAKPDVAKRVAYAFLHMDEKELNKMGVKTRE